MLSTKEDKKTKQRVARILVHSNPLLDREVRLRQSLNPLLNPTDVVYQLVGERLGELELERQKVRQFWQVLVNQIHDLIQKLDPVEEIKKMTDEELDEYVEANF